VGYKSHIPLPAWVSPQSSLLDEVVTRFSLANMLDSSCPPTIPSPRYSFPPFTMPTSKLGIRQRDTALRAALSRELCLATLKEPKSWDEKWRPLLLVQVILKEYSNIDSLHDHPYIYERWWMRDSRGVSLKLLLSNEDGTSMVLMGTSVWDGGEEEDCLTSRWVCSIAKGSFLIWRARCLCSCNGFSVIV